MKQQSLQAHPVQIVPLPSFRLRTTVPAITSRRWDVSHETVSTSLYDPGVKTPQIARVWAVEMS